jgi:HlyD family secretion protein
MDREIDAGFRRKQIIRRTVWCLIVLCLVGAALIFGQRIISPSIERSRVTTAKVEMGPIEATITSSGMVVPEIEQVLSSPVSARILKILKRPGAVLSKGDSILELDLNESRLATEKLSQQIEIKRNQQEKAKLELKNTLITLQSQWEIKNLECRRARATSTRNRALFREGLISEEQLREVELIEQRTGYELKQLEDSKRNAQQLTAAQIEGLDLEMKSLEDERQEARRQFELATSKSDRDGVLTWVVNEEGATVNKGAVLARIADLSTYHVEAAVSDVHAGRIAVGLPACVRIDEKSIAGRVSRINPAIKDGVITLIVDLDEKSNPLLRSNLRVDVLISTDRKDRVLRIRKGPFANAEGTREVFVVRGDMAVRTPARFGIASADHFEVIEDLSEGDEVIISDMSDYIHMKELRLK